jgi:APA family basic amino acid/polyamine antiporter
MLFVFVGLLGGLLPGDITGNLTNIGTLFAFVLVSLGVWILRRKNPGERRPFRTPLVPLVPMLGALFCAGMIIAIDTTTQLAALVWMVIGLGVYFLYAKSHSRLNAPNRAGGRGLRIVNTTGVARRGLCETAFYLQPTYDA